MTTNVIINTYRSFVTGTRKARCKMTTKIDKVLLGIHDHEGLDKAIILEISQESPDCFYQAIQAYSLVNQSFELGICVDNNLEWS